MNILKEDKVFFKRDILLFTFKWSLVAFILMTVSVVALGFVNEIVFIENMVLLITTTVIQTIIIFFLFYFALKKGISRFRLKTYSFRLEFVAIMMVFMSIFSVFLTLVVEGELRLPGGIIPLILLFLVPYFVKK